MQRRPGSGRLCALLYGGEGEMVEIRRVGVILRNNVTKNLFSGRGKILRPLASG